MVDIETVLVIVKVHGILLLEKNKRELYVVLIQPCIV